MRRLVRTRMSLVALFAAISLNSAARATDLAVRGEIVHTMAGEAIRDGVVLIRDGKIEKVGPAGSVAIPANVTPLRAAVVTPGLIDGRATAGLTGIFNHAHDQDQLEHSSPMQPALRAIDAYNSHEDLVAYLREYGVTTLHTGHAPGELISGQTMIVKTMGNTVDEAVIVPVAALAANLGPGAQKGGGKSPGTRGKEMEMLRAELLKAQAYAKKLEKDDPEKQPDRDLGKEALVRVLKGELPLMITAHRAQDIASALRLQREFGFRLWLDGAAEAYVLIDEIKAAGVPVFVHPPMMRMYAELKNASMETAARLRHAGVPIALESSFEDYVPKTRVILFEAAIAAANGLTFDEALGAITIDAARILGVADRVGSLEVGKDADLALYDGDPFEYTSHCIGVIINGQVVSETPR